MFKLLHTLKRRDSIWMIIDWCTESSYFLPIHEIYSLWKLVEIFVNEIVSLHGVPVSIMSDKYVCLPLYSSKSSRFHALQVFVKLIKWLETSSIELKNYFS